TSPRGYRALLSWLAGFGKLVRVGVEGTGAYGAALSRFLRREGVEVVEVDRPDRKTRRAQGKSDPVDAYAAALAALSGRAAGIPKSRDGKVEAIRALRVTRRSAVKAVPRRSTKCAPYYLLDPRSCVSSCVTSAPADSSTPAPGCAPLAISLTRSWRPRLRCAA
ncbi:MAG TPA: transposase, partial [Pseudonocardiaceae bacterium]|nr:transposase [Pseudonocardiaceae bacterium]